MLQDLLRDRADVFIFHLPDLNLSFHKRPETRSLHFNLNGPSDDVCPSLLE